MNEIKMLPFFYLITFWIFPDLHHHFLHSFGRFCIVCFKDLSLHSSVSYCLGISPLLNENLTLVFDESHTSANLGNDHRFIIKEYISIGMRHFGEAMRAYVQSRQYHTIVKSCVHLTFRWSLSWNFSNLISSRPRQYRVKATSKFLVNKHVCSKAIEQVFYVLTDGLNLRPCQLLLIKVYFFPFYF